MLRWFSILLIQITLSFNTSAQPTVETLWEFTSQVREAEEVKGVHLLRDDHMILVGYTHSKRRKKEGLVLLLNWKTGQLIHRQTFGGPGNDILYSVTQASNGLFYAAGATDQGRKNGQQGWLLQLDWNGETFEIEKETTFGEGGSDEFRHIQWLDEQESALLAGYKEEANNGYIWLLNVEDEKIVFEKEIGDGIYKDVIALTKAPGNRYWLCGNTRKAKEFDNQKGDVWITMIDPKGIEYQPVVEGSRFWEEARQATSTHTGALLIAGENWSRSASANPDAWVLQYDRQSDDPPQLIFGGEDEERLTAILKVPDGPYWMTSRIQSSSFAHSDLSHKLHIWQELEDKEAIYEKEINVGRGSGLEIKELIRTHLQTYLIIGNKISGKKSRPAIFVAAYKNGSHLASKSRPQLAYSNPRLADKDRNGYLSVEERAAFKFDLKNIGDTDIGEGQIFYSLKNEVAGLEVKRRKEYLSYLSSGETSTYAIPLAANKNLADGLARIAVRVEVSNKEVLAFELELKCSRAPNQIVLAAPKQNTTTLGWREPDITATGSRDVISTENQYTVQISVSSDRKLKSEDFKIYRNARELKDEKNNERILTQPVRERQTYQYTFTYTLRQLEEGSNEIYIQLGEQQLTPVNIQYTPRKPNLHVLAIGPTYEDLKFTAKDASDFAAEIKNQQQNGFFDQVFVDQHTTPATTTDTEIRKAFEKLYNRSINDLKPNRIKSNDYLMVFISGHGIKRSGKFRFLPTNFDPDAEISTSIDYETDIKKFLGRINCKKVIFIDACLSGNAKGAKAPDTKDLTKALIDANKGVPGMVAFTSCSADESSYEDEEWQNGAFTKSLLEAIRGDTVTLMNGETLNVDNGVKSAAEEKGNDIIVIGELIEFLRSRVSDLVTHRKGVSQTPTVTTNQLEENLPLLILN